MIFLFTQSLLPGGAEKQVVLLAKELLYDFPVSVIVFYGNKIDNKLLKFLKSENIEIITLKGNSLTKFFQLIYILKNNKNFILFNYLLIPNFFGGLAAKIVGGKSFGGIRSSKLDQKKILLNKITCNYLNYKTIFNNYKGLENCKKLGFSTSRSIIISNAIQINEDLITRKNTENPIIISVGRFQKVKDYKSALEAIKILFENKIKFLYYIIGWGELEKEIRDAVRKYNLESITKIFINPSNLSELYKKADIYLQTSLFEGLSNTVMEAMSYSLPCIVTNVGDNNRLVLNQETGFLCNVGDYKCIALKTEILINDYNLRLSFGEKAYNHVKENYSVEKMKNSYIELINSVNET